jgi:hypothetical protein
MIESMTKVQLRSVSAVEISNFMIYCTDLMYQDWWPNVHMAYHTLERYPDHIGNFVYFDEYVGKRRLKSYARLKEYIAGEKLVWQIKSVIFLPIWITLEFQDTPNGISVSHKLSAGYCGIGKVFDPILKLFFNPSFLCDLDLHVETEFKFLAEKIVFITDEELNNPPDSSGEFFPGDK